MSESVHFAFPRNRERDKRNFCIFFGAVIGEIFPNSAILFCFISYVRKYSFLTLCFFLLPLHSRRFSLIYHTLCGSSIFKGNTNQDNDCRCLDRLREFRTEDERQDEHQKGDRDTAAQSSISAPRPFEPSTYSLRSLLKVLFVWATHDFQARIPQEPKRSQTFFLLCGQARNRPLSRMAESIEHPLGHHNAFANDVRQISTLIWSYCPEQDH